MEYLDREYEVRVGENVYRLKPEKVWILKPPKKPGIVVALFRTPDGKTVRKMIDRLPP